MYTHTHTHTHTHAEADKVLAEVIRETEEMTLEEEEGVSAVGEEAEEEKGSGQLAEPGTAAAALLDEFLARYFVR